MGRGLQRLGRSPVVEMAERTTPLPVKGMAIASRIQLEIELWRIYRGSKSPQGYRFSQV